MKSGKYANINHLWGHLIVEELVRNGIDYFCLSPGSRSSPLTVAAAKNPKAETFIHFDERGAAFHALGHVAATGKPCALICTSGTAVANYLPAVVEASKKKLPLVILTADRPPELRQTGADQTIEQTKIFGEYVRYFMDMPCPTTDITPKFVLTTIDQAVYRAVGPLPGPVHLNCMFREPLAPTPAEPNLQAYTAKLNDWENTSEPFTRYTRSEKALNPAQLATVQKVLNDAAAGIIVVGKLSGPKEQQEVLALASRLDWPVFPDISSGLRLATHHPNVVHHFDQLLLADAANNFLKTDTVLHLGGRITSKRWYQFIERVQPRNYVMVLNHPLRNDPLHAVTLRIEGRPGDVCTQISASSAQKNIFTAQLTSLNDILARTISSELNSTAELTEMGITRTVSQNISEGHGLFLASSMPIRDMDMYADFKSDAVTIGANRGASGIDGLIATACGFAKGLKRPTTLMIGDLALLHDLNSLAMLKTADQPITIVVINNNGSAIFSFLPIAGCENVFEQYFGTPHGFRFEAAAKMFNLEYHSPTTPDDFTSSYREAIRSKRSVLIEVTTDRAQNFEAHKKLQTTLQQTVTNHIKNSNNPRGEVWPQRKLKVQLSG